METELQKEFHFIWLTTESKAVYNEEKRKGECT